MDLRNFDWSLVRSFLAVLDAGSLTGAARALGATQPTLGRHLAEFESRLGAPLFERTGRGMAPTATALAIADGAREMQAGAERLARVAAGRSTSASGTVRITTSQVAAMHLLPPVLAGLRHAHPGIAVELVASNHIDNLLRREADIAVRMARPRQPSLVARRIGEIAIGAYAHRDYLGRAGRPARLEDLLAHQLVGYDRDDTILRAMAKMGLPAERERFAVRTDDQVVYGALVAAGAGIGFLASYVTPQWPGLERVLPHWRPPALPCWLAVHREIRTNRLVRTVFDWLADRLPPAMSAPD